MKLVLLLPLLTLVYSERPEFSGNRGQFQENGFSFKHNNGRGSEKMEFGLAFIVEETEAGTPVCGSQAMIKLGEHANRSRVVTDMDDRVSSGRMNADTLDPSGRIGRGRGDGSPGRRPPRRQARDPDQSIDISEDLTVESTASRFTYSGGGGDGPTFTGELTAALITSSDEQNITVGSERQIVRNGNVKYTLRLSNFTFCGEERVCECDNGTNSTSAQLKVCFKTQGSRSGRPQQDNNTDDGLPEFDVGEARIKFSRRFIRQNNSASEIVEIPDENIESLVKSLDGMDVPVVCVTFERGSDLQDEDIIYDPTSEVDEDTDTTTTSGCLAAVPFTFLVMTITVLNVCYNKMRM